MEFSALPVNPADYAKMWHNSRVGKVNHKQFNPTTPPWWSAREITPNKDTQVSITIGRQETRDVRGSTKIHFIIKR